MKGFWTETKGGWKGYKQMGFVGVIKLIGEWFVFWGLIHAVVFILSFLLAVLVLANVQQAVNTALNITIISFVASSLGWLLSFLFVPLEDLVIYYVSFGGVVGLCLTVLYGIFALVARGFLTVFGLKQFVIDPAILTRAVALPSIGLAIIFAISAFATDQYSQKVWMKLRDGDAL